MADPAVAAALDDNIDFEGRPILMLHLNYAQVDIGSFLLVNPSCGYETDVVVRLTGATYDHWDDRFTLTVNRFEPLRTMVMRSPSYLSR